MTDLPLSILGGILFLLILLSGFFSGSETGMMALNRYRLRHLARQQHRGAHRVSELLKRPDRLIGLILLGNNFVNILASAIATIIALRLLGENGIVVATFLLTLVILIFAEVAPKTLAALHPERIAFPASRILAPLLRVFYPLVWLVNWIANSLLKLFRLLPAETTKATDLSTDELRTVVKEAGNLISRRHRRMLVSILDLEKVTVEDIMVPRAELAGIDLDDPEHEILHQLTTSQHTRLPVFRGDINHIAGIIHLRRMLGPVHTNALDKKELIEQLEEPYFVPLATPLNRQLGLFQNKRRRIALAVDEYGDIQGLVTLEDILEEIVGEFTTDPAADNIDIHPQADGTYLIDGASNIRELNRSMRWSLPENGPKTLNGLIIEYLENIPEPGTSLRLAGYPVEIVQTTEHGVKTVKLNPAGRSKAKARGKN